MMWTVQWWKDAAERALKTSAQFAIGAVGVSEMTSAFDLDFQRVAGIALFGAFISLLFSIGSIPFGDPDTPSLVKRK